MENNIIKDRIQDVRERFLSGNQIEEIRQNVTSLVNERLDEFQNAQNNAFKELEVAIDKLESQKGETLVIYSSAIKKDHSLLNQFVIRDFNIEKRASVLEIISNSCKCIAIAGTHGKTTTASILTHILSKSDIKFMSFVGGIMKNFKSNFLLRNDKLLPS